MLPGAFIFTPNNFIFVILKFLTPRFEKVPFTVFLVRSVVLLAYTYMHTLTHKHMFVCALWVHTQHSTFTLKIPYSHNAKQKTIFLMFPQGDLGKTIKHL